METIKKMLRSTGDMSQSQAPGKLAFSTQQRPKVGEAAGGSTVEKQVVECGMWSVKCRVECKVWSEECTM